MTYALGTSRGVITKAPLLLIDLETEEGVTGRSYLWCYFPAAMPAIANILEEVARVVKGERLAPADLWSKLAERFALIGVQGIVRMAMAGFDVAAWDALAIAAGWPLATLIGSSPKRILAYNSCGLGLMAPREVADEAEKLLARGFRAVKLRLGYPTLADDLAALHAVKKRVGSEIAVMVDYNQALSLAQALERGRALDQEGIYWLEEPIRHDDYAGTQRLCANSRRQSRLERTFPKARPWLWRSRLAPPITSCPTSNASAASPAGCAPRRSPPPPPTTSCPTSSASAASPAGSALPRWPPCIGSRCRHISTPR